MNAILIGYGEIGKAVYRVFSEKHYIGIIDPLYPSENILGTCDVMLVAIPYSEDFVEIVSDYQDRFSPKATIVFSSVAIGTCSKLNAVHSPVEGKHPHLAESIKKGRRFLGGIDPIAKEFVIRCFDEIVILPKPEFTEFLKLRSTTLYGVNIEFARYTNEVCKEIGMPYSCVDSYDFMYNDLYRELGMPEFQRYILTPPRGSKGGHCVTPNAKILGNQFPHEFVDIVAEKEKSYV